MRRRIIVGSLILITGGLLSLKRYMEKSQFTEPPLVEVATELGATRTPSVSTKPPIDATSAGVLEEAAESQPPIPDEPAVTRSRDSSLPSIGDEVVLETIDKQRIGRVGAENGSAPPTKSASDSLSTREAVVQVPHPGPRAVTPEIAPIQHVQDLEPKHLHFDSVDVHLRDAEKKWRRDPRRQTESRD